MTDGPQAPPEDPAAAGPGPEVSPDRPEAPLRYGLGPRQRSALISWATFTVTFAAVRAVTHAIKSPKVPARDVKTGGVHLHHYLWGIGLLGVSGGVAVHGSDSVRVNPAVAAGYGIGGALVIDELASLVHLNDVYWSKQGRWSVALAVALIGATGASLAGIPWVIRRRRRLSTAHQVEAPTSE